MDRYQETIDWLYNQLPVFQVLGPGAYKPGLETAKTLANAFGNPENGFKSIHVAGTNGKGSVSHSLASVLMAAGYKVGLYTSPHLVDFRERIRIDGKMMPKEAVVGFVEKYRDMDLGLEPSFFELTTIMAFDYFAREKVDYAVIEVGLGGRLDTTNIIKPELAIITNISLDHISLLGNTVEEIASEKAGIIKPGIPVVIGHAENNVLDVFKKKAKDEKAPIYLAQNRYTKIKRHEDSIEYEDEKWGNLRCDLIGDCQHENAMTVMQAAELLPVDKAAMLKGLADVQGRTSLAGRWMKLSEKPLVICDTGHNVGAWQWLAPRLAAIADKQRLHIVLGFAADKDRESIFKQLPTNAKYYFVAPNVKRAVTSEELADLGKKDGLDCMACQSVADGYRTAMEAATAEDAIFVGGSNFVVAELLPLVNCLDNQ